MNVKSNILDCCFDCLTTTQTLEQVETFIESGQSGYLCTVNVSILMMMREMAPLNTIVNTAQWIVADGMPLVWVSRFLDSPIPERVTGVEIVMPLAEMAARNNWGIFFLGGSREVVEAVQRKAALSVDNLTISGYADGYFDDQNAGEIADTIKRSGAKILIVAMGVPRQELFIDQYLNKCGASFAIGVGGSFDVIAGMTKRAPRWMQDSGLEWLYRTIQEPGRLLGRYLKTNSKFIILIAIEIVKTLLKKLKILK